MTSDKERQVLEDAGWRYDTVQRLWRAPDGWELPIEALIAAAKAMSEPAYWKRMYQMVEEHAA